jgi:predicted phosphodiesterase
MVAQADRIEEGPSQVTAWELTTVADDEAVAFAGTEVRHWVGLEPDTEYHEDGLRFRTLPRPPGERLATVATVNDLHFGETRCGLLEGANLGPVLSVEPGEPPYPETMSRAAAAEIAALDPDAVVAKGDLTTNATPEEYEAFRACYGFLGDRLVTVRGNHDSHDGAAFAADPVQERVLPGLVLAVLDTSWPGRSTGRLTTDQLDWLDELGQRSDRPVLAVGHHHPWNPGSADREPDYFGIAPDASERLVEVVARRPAIVAYAAGHTHRNRVRRFAATGPVPWAEVSAVKDFPGVWAEYRVFEGGILQVLRRIAAPDALDWTERTRAMFGGLYPAYSFGRLDDRCFPIWPR